jgi:hypothetical protein
MKKPAHRPRNSGGETVLPAVPASIQLPEPWCWVAEAWTDAEGRETSPEARNAVGIFAVSVHEQYPADVRQRLQLLREVSHRLGCRVPTGNDSLWVYPGGYFGFNAAAFREDEDKAWPGFDAPTVLAELPAVLRAYPSRARLAFGADDKRQQVWVCWLAADGSLGLRTITRHDCDLPQRGVEIGPVRVAFFVCGEFTGSETIANGPYCGNTYLTDPAAQLSDCRLLIDVAHSRVKGSVHGPPGPRLVHQQQMRRFAVQGAAVLTHHHPGWQTAGRARDDCQSNWVVFRGGTWLDSDRVQVLP